VLAGANEICACTIHQNMKFIISGAQLYIMIEEEENPVKKL
jgi:hypothetical protein